MSISFADLGVSDDLVRALHTRGIEVPFPIQVATMADALAGHDVCGKAPTGSGKTIAFGIPVVSRVAKASPRRPKALVLAPTRELAAQICEELTLLGAPRESRVASFYGGVGFGPQLDALRRGVDIAVACPGRLADLIDRGAVRLDDVEVVVVDEADRMADMGFMPVVRELLDQVSERRQTLLFSATLDGDVKELIRRYQHNPKRYEVNNEHDAIGESATHYFWRTEASERTALATRIVTVHKAAMVFCRTKRGVDRLVKQFKMSGLDVGAIHGDRSQAQRDQALEAFRSQRLQVLVGTDVAARGIHVEGVDCVVHFDPPEDEKAYVHRSGRTGRAGAGGTVVSLVTREHQGFIRKLQSTLKLKTGIEDPNEEILSATPTFVKNTTRPHTPARSQARSSEARSTHGRPSRPFRARTGRPVRSGEARSDRAPEGRPNGPSAARPPRQDDDRRPRRQGEGRPPRAREGGPTRSAETGSNWGARATRSGDGRPLQSNGNRNKVGASSRLNYAGGKPRKARPASR